MPIRSDGEETRARILKAAAEVFGKKGFRRATNHDISAVCGVNTAAISYYFRDKAGLYREAWEYLQAASSERYVSRIKKEGKDAVLHSSKNEKLDYLKQLCRALYDWMRDEECWDSEILRYEMTELSGMLDAPERDAVAYPLAGEMKEVLSALVETSADDLPVVLGVQGVAAALRGLYQNDRADLSGRSDDEIFNAVYSSFVNSFGLLERPGASRKANQRPQAKDEHPELGVTDEIAFVLKSPTDDEVKLMKKLAIMNKPLEDEPEHVDNEHDDSDSSGFTQQELW